MRHPRIRIAVGVFLACVGAREALAAACLGDLRPTGSGLHDVRHDDFVGITVWKTDGKGDAVVLSTEAADSSPMSRRWRFRALPAGTSKKSIDAVRLSIDATYVEVAYSDGRTIVVDVTNQILQLPETEDDANLRSSRRAVNGDHALPVTFRECTQAVIAPDQEALQRKQLRAFMAEHGFVPYAPTGKEPAFRYFSAFVNSDLYAPILQLFQSELIRPSPFEVWNNLVPPGVAATRDATSKVTQPFQESLFREYQISTKQCAIYFSASQKSAGAGSWIIQYWFYYPFDVGGVGEHLHDSEHLFVEVDKLGGTVRRIAAAGHGMWAPNNIYHTFQHNSIPVPLPLFAIVEYGKHATAPDIDGDGWFTPGVDSNNYYDTAKVWGVRDTMGVTDSNVRPFAATMMVKRGRRNMLFTKAVSEAFRVADDIHREIEDAKVPPEPVCSLRPLPDHLPQTVCKGASAPCARSQVGGHADFQDPQAILKPAIYPPFGVRVAYTFMPTATKVNTQILERSHRILAGVTFELARLGGMPGRMAFEGVIDPESSEGQHFNGIGVRYEWMTSNLTGLYMGLSWIDDDLEDFQAPPGEDRTQWFSTGILLEVPLNKRVTGQGAVGLTYNNYYRLAWDFRAGFSLAFRTPHRSYGIKQKTPSPY
jgi:hypothetical protein